METENKNLPQLQTQQVTSEICIDNWKRLKENFISEIPALDLLGEIVSARDVAECIAIFTSAFGKNYAAEISERVNLLFGMVLEEHWTNRRFIATAKWIIKNKPYRDWTIADFFSATTQRLYPYSKYLTELHEKGKSLNSETQWYNVNGLTLWAYKKDGALPFPNLEPAADKQPAPVKTESVRMPDQVRTMLGTRKSGEERPARTGGVKPLSELMQISDTHE